MNTFPTSISFEVAYPPDPRLPTKGKPWVSPYIQLSNPQSSLQYLKDSDEFVAPSTIYIRISYPLEKTVLCKIQSSKPSGFTRSEIAQAVADEYRRIYDEENESSTVPEERCCDKDPECTLLNRAQTNGKYGIWGHGLEDLVMHSIVQQSEENGIPVYGLGIDS